MSNEIRSILYGFSVQLIDLLGNKIKLYLGEDVAHGC